MNNPQFWGLARTFGISAGLILTALGIVNLTEADITQLVDHTIAVLMSIVGLVTLVWPIIQGFKARKTDAMAKTVVAEDPNVVMQELAASPLVKQIVTTTNTTANAVPSPKVVGPAG